MTLSPVDIASYVAAGLLAASRLISVVQPLWAKLPRWIAVVLPVLIVSIPQVVDAAGLVKTDIGIVQWLITSAALLVPGIAEAEKAKPAVVTTTPPPPAA